MLRGTCLLCTQERPLIVYQGLHTVPGVELESAEYKASALPSVPVFLVQDNISFPIH